MSSDEPTEAPSVYDHIAAVIDQIASVSWQKLGLQPDIITGKIETNLPEAKVAIDLVAHLASLIEARLDDGDRRQIQGLVSNLRVNFVQKSKEAQR